MGRKLLTLAGRSLPRRTDTDKLAAQAAPPRTLARPSRRRDTTRTRRYR